MLKRRRAFLHGRAEVGDDFRNLPSIGCSLSGPIHRFLEAAVATSSIVRVILRTLRTAFNRLMIARAFAMTHLLLQTTCWQGL